VAGISGFASPATITVPAMLILSAGVSRTGLVQRVGQRIVSNNASVVLMVPVAAEAAVQVGASPFAFVLAVAFAASTAFLTPVGYQTNFFVYGSGGYRFTDYFRVGAPLQLLLSVVTTLGIAALWGLRP
jgi:di/tricarboxylate transporter